LGDVKYFFGGYKEPTDELGADSDCDCRAREVSDRFREIESSGINQNTRDMFAKVVDF
jgi:hypothetical protein